MGGLKNGCDVKCLGRVCVPSPMIGRVFLPICSNPQLTDPADQHIGHRMSRSIASMTGIQLQPNITPEPCFIMHLVLYFITSAKLPSFLTKPPSSILHVPRFSFDFCSRSKTVMRSKRAILVANFYYACLYVNLRAC